MDDKDDKNDKSNGYIFIGLIVPNVLTVRIIIFTIILYFNLSDVVFLIRFEGGGRTYPEESEERFALIKNLTAKAEKALTEFRMFYGLLNRLMIEDFFRRGRRN